MGTLEDLTGNILAELRLKGIMLKIREHRKNVIKANILVGVPDFSLTQNPHLLGAVMSRRGFAARKACGLKAES